MCPGLPAVSAGRHSAGLIFCRMRFRVSMKLYNWAPHFLYQMPQWETERVVFRAVFGPGTLIYFQKEVRSCHISQACDSFFVAGASAQDTWVAVSESDVLTWGTCPWVRRDTGSI